MKFGEKVKKLRLEHSLTQEAVANAIGVTRRTYVSYEQDGRYPRNREIYTKLAELFDCNTNYLLTEDEGFILEANEKYGSRGKRQAEELVNELVGMFAGGELEEEDRDIILRTLQEAYWRCKEDNKKYTPKKYRKED